MLTKERRTGLAVLTAVAGVVIAMACGGSGGGGGYGTTPTPTTTPTPSATADVTITINGMSGASSFSNPAVKAGQKVAWHNGDSIAHTASGSTFDTGLIPGGATSAPIAFANAGTFDYHCNVHPSMVGTLTVTP